MSMPGLSQGQAFASRAEKLEKWEKELVQRESELTRRKAELDLMAEAAQTQLKVKRKRLEQEAAMSAQLRSEVEDKGKMLSQFKSMAATHSAQLQALRSRIEEIEEAMECSVCM
eukprot:2050788-Rhodomonas_salina.1